MTTKSKKEREEKSRVKSRRKERRREGAVGMNKVGMVEEVKNESER